MSVFRFKRFSVINEASPMKVGTDGVILGAAVPLGGAEKSILDVGTGTGVVALMLAQRTEGTSCRITGIDIDEAASREAEENFRNSPWSDKLEARCVALGDFTPEGSIDLIVSNPPFFDSSLLNHDSRRSEARHSVTLSYRELLCFAAEHLSKRGHISMILPSDTRASLCREARSRSLYPETILNIRSTERKAPSRIVADFSRRRGEAVESELTIHNGSVYSSRYLELMKNFYLFA